MSVWFWIVLWAAAIGVVGWLGLRWWEATTATDAPKVTPIRAGAAMAFVGLVIAPVISHVGTNAARSNLLRYTEFWGGYELRANRGVTPCTRDGSCKFTYSCDSYNHVHHHPATYDSKGQVQTPAHDEDHTHYHSCPYATEEWDFSIDTTLGDYHIERTFPERAQQWPGCNHDCTSGLRSDVRIGAPPFWQAAHDRIAAGDPGPVTAVRGYDNFILASSRTILKKYGGALDRYQAKKLVPGHTAALRTPIHDFYYADKVLFAGMRELPGWKTDLSRFNAALGSELQGDLHLVIVDARDVDNPDDYTGAVNAYWQSSDLGKRALSKNGIGVVLGARAGKVAWARAFTGMPIGNDAMLLDIRNDLKGLALDPDVILGRPKGTIAGDKVKVTPGEGALAKIIWGEHRFKRICMRCKEEGTSGYSYLKGEIQPTPGQRNWMIVIGIVASLLTWGVAIAVPGPSTRSSY